MGKNVSSLRSKKRWHWIKYDLFKLLLLDSFFFQQKNCTWLLTIHTVCSMLIQLVNILHRDFMQGYSITKWISWLRAYKELISGYINILGGGVKSSEVKFLHQDFSCREDFCQTMTLMDQTYSIITSFNTLNANIVHAHTYTSHANTHTRTIALIQSSSYLSKCYMPVISIKAGLWREQQ